MPPADENRTGDAADVVLNGFQAVARKEIGLEVWWQALANRNLAAAATTETVARIVSFVRENAGRLKQGALLLARGIERHATALFTLGRYQLALPLYTAIQPVYKRHAPPELLADFWNHRGFVLRELHRSQEALRAFDQAIALRDRLVNAEGRSELANTLATALMNRGNALQDLGRLHEAVAAFDQAIAIRTRLVDVEGRSEVAYDLATALMNKGNAQYLLGGLWEAVATCEQAIAIYNRLVKSQGRSEAAYALATALRNKAAMLSMLGQLREAVATSEQAIAVYGRLVHTEGRSELADDLAGALTNKGSALYHLGQFPEAVAALDQAIAIRTRLVDVEGRSELANALALTLMNKGNALNSLGEREEALAAYEQVVAIRDRLVNSEGRSELAYALAGALLDKGIALAGLGREAEAAAAYDRAISIFDRLVHSESRADIAEALGKARYNKALLLERAGELGQALAIYLAIDPSLFRGNTLRHFHATISDNLWQQNRREEALQHLHRAVEVYRAARRTAGLDETFLEYIGQLSGFLARAVSRTLEAGRDREAFAVVQDSKAAILSDLRSQLPEKPEDEPAEVLTARGNLVHWLRTGPGEVVDEAGVRAWQAEHGRRTQEYLRTWRIARAGRSGSVLSEAPAALERIQASLPAGWAVLDFWRTGNEEVAVFLVTRDTFEVHRVTFPVETASFADGLTALHEVMHNPLACLEDEAANDSVLDDLHACLFAPLRPRLRDLGITGLYLVPQGYLHALPLHAVRRTVKGETRYLCDDFNVAYLPSSALLPLLPELDARGPCLSLANPDRGTRDTLPFSEWEAVVLSGRDPGSRLHRGHDATFEATRDWDRFATLHFSCHGAGDRQFAPLSRLYLRDDLLLAHDVGYRRPALRPGALVVLNGCQTGVKDWRAADEGLGLMSTFLGRGAGLVVSTMWSVVDACAAEMVLHFTEQLVGERQTPAEALRRAQGLVRRLTWEDYDRRSAEATALFDPERDTHEMSKLLAQRAWVSARCGHVDEALAAAEQAAPLLRRNGFDGEAHRLVERMRHRAVLSVKQKTQRVNPFDHPVLWSAFQLVGRVA